MQILLVSDESVVSHAIRQFLLHEGEDCPASSLVRLEEAPGRLSQAQPPPEVVFVVMEPDPERALAVLPRLHGPATTTATRVLAVGQTSDPKLVLRALRAGADDYLAVEELETELETALGRLRTLRTQHDRGGRLITVLGPSGGSGSSTLAVNVATVLAKEHNSAILIDLKLETGDLAALLDLKPSYTLADLCQNLARVDRTLFEQSLARHDNGVRLLAPPRLLEDIRHVTPEGIGKAISLARAAFPYVIVDLDHSYRSEQTQVLEHADAILLVLRLDFASLRNTKRTLDYLDHLGISRETIKVVVNRYGQPKEVPYSKAEDALGLKVSHYIPDDPKTVNRANNNGVPLVLESPSAKVARSLTQLAASVNGKHKAP